MSLPTTGISTSMVASAIGEGSNDVGTLCKSSKINKWSKYKPISLPYLNTDGLPNWYKGLDGKCGMAIPIYNSAGAITTQGTFLYDLKNHIVNWVYNKPTGGELSPYRLGDFRGYNHNAVHPISIIETANIFLNSPGDWFEIFVDMAVPPGSTSNLLLEDIEHNAVPMSNFYLGVMLHKEDNTYYAATSESTLGQGGYSVRFDNMQGAVGNLTASYFLLSYKKGLNDIWQSGVYIPIDIPQTSITLHSAGTQIYVSPYGYWEDQNHNSVIYSVQLINNTGSSINVVNVQASLIYTTGSQLPENGIILSTNNLGNYTVPGNSVYDVNGGIFYHQKVSDRVYWIGAKADGYATNYSQIEDPYP